MLFSERGASMWWWMACAAPDVDQVPPAVWLHDNLHADEEEVVPRVERLGELAARFDPAASTTRRTFDPGALTSDAWGLDVGGVPDSGVALAGWADRKVGIAREEAQAAPSCLPPDVLMWFRETSDGECFGSGRCDEMTFLDVAVRSFGDARFGTQVTGEGVWLRLEDGRGALLLRTTLQALPVADREGDEWSSWHTLQVWIEDPFDDDAVWMVGAQWASLTLTWPDPTGGDVPAALAIAQQAQWDVAGCEGL
jgi:hypothetical protein